MTITTIIDPTATGTSVSATDTYPAPIQIPIGSVTAPRWQMSPAGHVSRAAMIACVADGPLGLVAYELRADIHGQWCATDPDGEETHGVTPTGIEAAKAEAEHHVCSTVWSAHRERERVAEVIRLREENARLRAMLDAKTAPVTTTTDPDDDDYGLGATPAPTTGENYISDPFRQSVPRWSAERLASLGERICRVRLAHGWTYAQMASHARETGGPSVSGRTWHYWASGAHSPQGRHETEVMSWLDVMEAEEIGGADEIDLSGWE